ncbi:hypothetical protein BLAT2472_140051 [Burkholderia latens]
MLDQALNIAASARLSVLQGEFWLNGIYAGISEVAYAMQDLSVNRVGIFPTRCIEKGANGGGRCANSQAMWRHMRRIRRKAVQQGCRRSNR